MIQNQIVGKVFLGAFSSCFLMAQIALAASTAGSSTLFSTSAGRVGNHVVTTREVMLNHLVETALFPGEKLPALQLENVKEKDFIRETTSVLLEYAIAAEAEAFSAVPLAPDRLQANLKRLEGLRKNAVWVKLAPTLDEQKKMVAHKLRAKDFIKSKEDSASIPISDDEAEEYFNANRLKFENLPFANFKENIKRYLIKQRVDKRLKDWFELLQSKYHVRNMLAE